MLISEEEVLCNIEISIPCMFGSYSMLRPPFERFPFVNSIYT